MHVAYPPSPTSQIYHMLKGERKHELRCPKIFPVSAFSHLTRAPLGYFYNAPHWGGGLFRAPPLISETTGPILKIQAAFESPGKTV